MTQSSYTCPYCRQSSTPNTDNCPQCGAPVSIGLKTTEGGWTDMPPIADLTRIQAGRSSVQIEGSIGAVADWNLAAGEGLYFPHHGLKWVEPSVTLGTVPIVKPWTRYRAGRPLVMLNATGPGHIAFAHQAPGEVIAIPLPAGATVEVGENRLLVATQNVAYDWTESDVWYTASGSTSADQGAGAGLLRMGLDLTGVSDDDNRSSEQTEFHYPVGRYLDRFTATDRPGLVLIGAGGNAYQRDLAEGETILVKPPALLFKDPTVAMQLHVEYPAAGLKLWRTWGNRYLWLRLWGPGRVGIESQYAAAADPGTHFGSMSPATQHLWT